jgi:hypothetical protein
MILAILRRPKGRSPIKDCVFYVAHQRYDLNDLEIANKGGSNRYFGCSLRPWSKYFI